MTTIFKHKLPIANAVASFSLLLFIVACTQNKQEKTSDNVENKIDSVKVFTIETDTVKKYLFCGAASTRRCPNKGKGAGICT